MSCTRTGGSWTHEYAGLSTDTKPTRMEDGKKIPNGSAFIEMDTGDVYLYDKENDQWRKL